MRVPLMLAAAVAVPAFAGTEVTTGTFGQTKDGVEVPSFEIANDAGMTVRLISLGATVQSLTVPDRDGNSADVVLGFDDVAGYQGDSNPYFGCVVGRVGNRIANATFDLDGKTYTLKANNGDHHLHGGGENALSRKVWDGKVIEVKDGAGVEFTVVSPDGEEGYPGKLNVTVRYIVPHDKNMLRIVYRTKSDAATPVNLTNHAYFNLAGHDAGPVKDHALKINAERYTATDDELIPTGGLAEVSGTPYDFRKPTRIGKRLSEANGGTEKGYDLNYVLDKKDGVKGPQQAVRVSEPKSGRVMLVRTTEPGVQLYTGNFMGGISGKGGATYEQYGAFCLETQHFPDSVHHENFPSTILKPGETFNSTTSYEFRVAKPKAE